MEIQIPKITGDSREDILAFQRVTRAALREDKMQELKGPISEFGSEVKRVIDKGGDQKVLRGWVNVVGAIDLYGQMLEEDEPIDRAVQAALKAVCP